MKNSLLIIAAFASLLFLACNKDRNPKSTYYIDGKKYETRKFEGFIVNGIAKLVYTGNLEGIDQKVSFGFFLSHFPKEGQFLVKGDNQAGTAGIGLILGDKIYRVSSYNASLAYATKEDNGFGKYTIEPTWLRLQVPDPADSSRAIEGNDSVRFWGTIYESKDKTVR